MVKVFFELFWLPQGFKEAEEVLIMGYRERGQFSGGLKDLDCWFGEIVEVPLDFLGNFQVWIRVFEALGIGGVIFCVWLKRVLGG